MAEFDPGPTGAFATHWDNRPSYNSVKARFRMNWGPIYYRGRLDGTAKVIIIGQDPAADENVLKTPESQAVIAFGAGAHKAVDLWPGAAGLFVAKPLHPSFRDDAGLRADWNNWLPQIRPHVTSEVPPDMAPYAGSTFKKADLENIPPRDLPFGIPKWMGTGDMAWRTSPTQIAWKSLGTDG